MSSPYVSPVPSNIRVKRMDHGQDYQGNPGQKIVAIGDAVVDGVKSDPGGFGTVVYYTLTDGPHAGQQIYVGHAQASVMQGQKVAAGDPVATLQQNSGGDAKGLVGWVEIGLAKNGAPQYSRDDGGKRFQEFLAGAQKATEPTPPTSTTPPPTDTSSTDKVVPPAVGTPPGAADPLLELPGSAQHYLPGEEGVASTWQSLSALNDLSPDTQRLIGLAGGTGG